MATFNRILNIFVMLMAIAAVVFGWKLFQRRGELRGRGDLQARQIHEAAKQLDENSPAATKMAEALNIKDLGEGELGWKKYHDNDTAYKSKLEDFVRYAGKVRTQRDNLADSIVAVAKDFEDEGIKRDTLNNPEEYEVEFKKVSDNLKTYYNRDRVLSEALAKYSAMIDPAFAKTGKDLRPVADYEEAKSKVEQGIERLNTLYDRYSTAMIKIVEKLGSQRVGVTRDDVKEISQASVVTLLKGMDKVVDDLNHLALLEAQVKKLNEQISKLKSDVEEANDTITRQKTMIDTRDKNITNLRAKIVDLEAAINDLKGSGPKPQGDTKYDGKVVKVNYDYNYAIISVDEKDKIGYGAQLTVARDREYICKVKVTKIYKKYAVAEVLSEDKVGDIVEGDRVVWLD